MDRLGKKFRELKKKHRKAFIAFIMTGDPSFAITKKLIFELEKSGVDIIELGVPFSDPLADGPTIQRSSERALKNKVNIGSVSNLVRNVRLKTQIPIVFLTYSNLIYNYGLERFVKKCKLCGVDGVIVPDLPIEESRPLYRICKKQDFSLINLVAPTSSNERIKKIAASSAGFIYYVSLTGTTGARKRLPGEIFRSIKNVKRLSNKPVCVGFGISTPKQVKLVSKAADGVIVGSAVVKVIEKNIGKRDLIENVSRFIKTLVKSCR